MGEFDDWEELGPPEIRPVPTGRPRGATIAIVVSVVVASVVLASVAVFLIVRAASGDGPQATTTPRAPVTVTESFTVTASPSATNTTVESTSPASPVVATQPQFVRATKVAYRQDGALWVAEESGAGPVKIVASASGEFSLSPDGATIAFVDGGTKSLALVDIASARVTTVGPADVRLPVWSPSSKWLAFTNGTEVRRVEADGSKLRYLGKGTQVAIGPSGSAYAYGSDGTITYVDANDKSTKIATAKGRLDDLALGSGKVFYAIGGASRSAMSLHVVGIDGAGDKELAGAPSDTKAGMYDDLQLSPDETYLAYAVSGDDLHSRLRAMHADGTSDIALSLRHDDYLLKWSSDGSRVLFIDGNAVQGDTTQLMSARPDGTQRLTLLKGAGI